MAEAKWSLSFWVIWMTGQVGELKQLLQLLSTSQQDEDEEEAGGLMDENMVRCCMNDYIYIIYIQWAFQANQLLHELVARGEASSHRIRLTNIFRSDTHMHMCQPRTTGLCTLCLRRCSSKTSSRRSIQSSRATMAVRRRRRNRGRRASLAMMACGTVSIRRGRAGRRQTQVGCSAKTALCTDLHMHSKQF